MFLNNKVDYLLNLSQFKDLDLANVFQDEPLHYVDIGARGGVHDLVTPFASNVSVLGFEPDEKECSRLINMKEVVDQWANFALEPIGLYNSKGIRKLYLHSVDTNHSLLPANSKFVNRYSMEKFKVIGDTPVEVDLLDNIYDAKFMNSGPFAEFVKIDTQGTEYEILQGAKKVLQKDSVALVIEVSFFELYEGQKLFCDIEQLLRKNDFAFFGFSSKLHTRSCKFLDKQNEITRERVMQADAVFFRDPVTSEKTSTKRQNQSIFIISLLLGFYDYAAEIASNILYLEDSIQLQKALGLIKKLAYMSPDKLRKDVDQLKRQIDIDPEKANISVGGFVDERRSICNYDDVLGVSPLPTTF
jgi:FkbM family methyltransferase